MTWDVLLSLQVQVDPVEQVEFEVLLDVSPGPGREQLLAQLNLQLSQDSSLSLHCEAARHPVSWKAQHASLKWTLSSMPSEAAGDQLRHDCGCLPQGAR